MVKETQMAKAESQALSTEMRSLVDGDISADKIIIPRVSLLQALSHAVQERGSKQGTYENTVTHENYGETINLIPIKVGFGALYMEKESGLKCRSADGITNMFGDKCAQCPFGEFHGGEWKGDKPPKCAKTVDLLGLEEVSLQPAVYTFCKTAYKEGKRLATQPKLCKTAQAIRIGSLKEKNNKGIFFAPQVKALTPIDQKQYEVALQWRQSLSDQEYDLSHEMPVDDIA